METGLRPVMALARRMDSCLRRNDGAPSRPDCSTLSRRVRGVLSPSRERGDSALARLWIPAYAGMTVCYAKVSIEGVGMRPWDAFQ